MAELKDWIAVFGNPEIINYFPAEGKKGENMSFIATINKVTSFTKPGKESIKFNITSENDKTFDATAWLNGENTPQEFIEAAKSLNVGDQAEFGVKWTEPKSEGGRSYCNIQSIVPIRQINSDTTPPPSQQKSAPAKNDIKKDKFDPDLSKKQTCLNGAVQMVVAWINAGQKMGTEDVEKTYDLLMGIIEK